MGLGAAAAVLVAVYFHGFSFVNPQCHRCAVSFDVRHPVLMARFLSILVSNVMPPFVGHTTFPLAPVSSSFISVHEIVGALILIVAGYVVVQSLR